VQVLAFSSPRHPDWRWRIINYAGETIEESPQAFATIAAAVTEGTKRLQTLDIVDTSVATYGRRSTSHLRAR